MKILALNHYFDQDLESLKIKAGKRHEIREVSYQYFRQRFLRIFSESVLTSRDFSLYGSSQYTSQRLEWKKQCRLALYELYRLFPFDLFILPSDTFPYIRDIVEPSHDLGVPVVVCQKETTISNYTMEVHSKKIGRYFPFKSDYMTACSERQKAFWLNAGAQSDKIEITGQPRFDMYSNPTDWKSLDALGIKTLPDRKIITFLSYSLGAYIPIEEYNAGRYSWTELHTDTLKILSKHVNKGNYQLIIKPHPQQPSNEIRALSDRVAQTFTHPLSAQLVSADIDTRHLLANSDVVVAFQTTAVLEALLLNRKVIYTCWGDAYECCRQQILPYNEHPNALHSAESAAALDRILQGETDDLSQRNEKDRLALFEYYLGPSDGASSERTLETLEKVVRDYRPVSPQKTSALRNRLLRHRNQHLLAECFRHCLQSSIDVPVFLTVLAASLAANHSTANRFASDHLSMSLNRAKELVALLIGKPDYPNELVGRRLNPWISAIHRTLRIRKKPPP